MVKDRVREMHTGSNIGTNPNFAANLLKNNCGVFAVYVFKHFFPSKTLRFSSHAVKYNYLGEKFFELQKILRTEYLTAGLLSGKRRISE